MDHGKSFSFFFIMQKRVRFRNGTHISFLLWQSCVVAWQRKNGGWAMEEEGWYYVPFVSGLALCSFLVCHARPGKRHLGQQMCLLGGQGVEGTTKHWFSV